MCPIFAKRPDDWIESLFTVPRRARDRNGDRQNGQTYRTRSSHRLATCLMFNDEKEVLSYPRFDRITWGTEFRSTFFAPGQRASPTLYIHGFRVPAELESLASWGDEDSLACGDRHMHGPGTKMDRDASTVRVRFGWTAGPRLACASCRRRS